MKILILEDQFIRIDYFKRVLSTHELFITKDVNLAIDKLTSEKFDGLFVDNDLSDMKLQGTDFARMLFRKRQGLYFKFIIIHSMNEPAANSIFDLLEEGLSKLIYKISFHQLLKEREFKLLMENIERLP